MTTLLDKPMVFKDFKSAVDFAHKEYYKDMPRHMVEMYVYFGDKHPEILEKIIRGEPLNEEEKKIMEAGKEYKHTTYNDGDEIDNMIEVKAETDAPKELINELFTDEVKPEDSEKLKLEDVPEPVNNEKIKEIISQQDLEEGNF